MEQLKIEATQYVVGSAQTASVKQTAGAEGKEGNELWFNAHIYYCTIRIVLVVTDWFITSITADDQ